MELGDGSGPLPASSAAVRSLEESMRVMTKPLRHDWLLLPFAPLPLALPVVVLALPSDLLREKGPRGLGGGGGLVSVAKRCSCMRFASCGRVMAGERMRE